VISKGYMIQNQSYILSFHPATIFLRCFYFFLHTKYCSPAAITYLSDLVGCVLTGLQHIDDFAMEFFIFLLALVILSFFGKGDPLD